MSNHDWAIWKDMREAPKDRKIKVLVAGREGLPGFVTTVTWHPDGGFCVDELREAIGWCEIVERKPLKTFVIKDNEGMIVERHTVPTRKEAIRRFCYPALSWSAYQRAKWTCEEISP